MSLQCAIDKQTGYCEYCQCQSTKNKETKEWYCIALEASLNEPQWDDGEEDEPLAPTSLQGETYS